MIELLKIIIWERGFSLPIEYDRYEGETVTKEQIKAAKRFISHPEWLEKSKTYVEEYCKVCVIEDEENIKMNNIFSYIKPEYVFVKREEKPRIALMCKYRYDLEHGLAIVFSPNGEITVGIQDMIL